MALDAITPGSSRPGLKPGRYKFKGKFKGNVKGGEWLMVLGLCGW